MIAARNDFVIRSQEIEVYFDFANDFLNGSIAMTSLWGADKLDALHKTIKANAFLLLYNIIESTVGSAVEAIFDDLATKQIRFDDCRTEVQKVVLNNLKKHNVDKIQVELTDISLHVITKTFQRRSLFSGNVDARKIRATAKRFGFRRPDKDGQRLLQVKNARNDLAHGEKSFAEVGRDATPSELQKTREQVMEYLDCLLHCVEEYIVQQTYLAVPPLQLHSASQAAAPP